MNDDLDMRAAEYVLGLHEAPERDALRRDMERDPALRAAVERWERRLAPMAQTAAQAAPPPDMLARIKAALPPRLGEQAVVIELRRALRRWKTGAVLSGALAASLLVFVGARTLQQAAAPADVWVAAVNRGGGAPALLVRVDLAAGRVFIRPVSAEAPSGRSLELWYIAQGGSPRSMGLVGAAADTRPLPEGARLEKATFAVTVEPPGGSPTGGPTGPVVYSGELIRE